MTPSVEYDRGSFKDPSGRVFFRDRGVYRALSVDGRRSYEALVDSGLYRSLVESGLLVRAEPVPTLSLGLDPGTLGPWVLAHDAIPFITYPFEWSFEMLRDAALLTLDVLERSLAYDFILKDATPFNIQFRGGRPVHIDILSFEPYRAGEPWMGYSQFCQTFLYPLMLTAYRGVAFQPWLRGSLGVLSSTDMSRLVGLRDLLRPGVLTHVKLAAWFQRSFEATDVQLTSRFADVRFSKQQALANVARLRRTLLKLRFGELSSAFKDYSPNTSYTESDARAKREFVERALGEARPGTVWDLGCNVGLYSEMAARAGARVVAIDADPVCIDRLYRMQKAGERSRSIQALVGDFTNPTPPLGWSLVERRPWSERGRADFFIALALVHHLALTGNVPVAEVASFLRRTAPAGVTEFVTKEDPLVRRLLSNRKDVFSDYTRERFEQELSRHFSVVRRQSTTAGNRIWYQVAARAG